MIAKKLLTTIAFAFVLLFSGCAKDDFEEIDGVCPLVVSTVPEDGDFDIPLNQIITATFNEKMNPATITETSFTISANGALIDGTVSYNGLTATFDPKDALEPDTEYTGTITTMAKDERGNALQENYVWTFTTLPEFVITITTDPTTGPITTGAGVYLKGTAVTVTAAAYANYTFINWTTVDGVFVSNLPTYILPPLMDNVSLVANYSLVAYEIKLLASPLAGGIPDGAGFYNFESTAIVTANPAIGYNFVNWTENGVIVPNAGATYSFTVSGARTLQANYVLKTYTLDVTIIGSGTVTKSPVNGPYNHGSTVTLTAQAATDFVFTGWSGPDGTGIISPLPVTMDGNKNITATFTAVASGFTLNVTAQNGSVDKNPNLTTYNDGDNVILTPTPDPNYVFDSWSGDATGNDNPLTVLMDSNKDITANFILSGVATGPGVIDLGTAGDFVILSKSGIDRVGVTSITGNIGVSPIDQTAITGFSQIMDVTNTFSTSIYVNGNIYAADYTPPTPNYLTTAVGDMETAFTTANGITTNVIVDLGAGDISGKTLAPGLYKWGTGLLITNEGVTLSGGPNDTWVFQISDDFTINNDAIITLAGGAQAKNIFWVTRTQALLGSNVQFKGNILAQTLISVNTGTSVTGRLLSQTAVTLKTATVVEP